MEGWGQGVGRAPPRPTSEWRGHLRCAIHEERDGQCAAVLAVPGVVQVGGCEAYISLERRGEQV